MFAGKSRWLRLLDERIPRLLWNTISLAGVVTFLALLIGISLAWLVIRTDLPGKRIWRWVLALPLVIPPYVGAVTYIIIFGYGGFGLNVYSFGGVVMVLSMFTYPYVYLIVSASLKKMNQNYEEVAESVGMGAFQIFWKVNLPLLRPAIGAGTILIMLYVFSDFGAVSMLRYVSFTAAIYFQRAGFDTASASVLSLVLVVLTMLVLWAESSSKRRNNYYQTSNTFRALKELPLGKWKPLALLYVCIIFVLAVGVPIGVLMYWSKIGIGMGVLNSRFWGYALNSMKVSSIAAIISMILTTPIIYLKMRYPSKITYVIDRLCYSGYALPGVIIGLGFVFIFNNHFPMLYGTFYVIALAFVVRFLPQSLQAGEASLSQISPKIDEAARSLGFRPWEVMLKVVLPNMLPGILAGGALVFVSAIKELPITLMLRPPGFDTLAVRVYFEAHEAFYHLAAPSALLIILVSIIPLNYLLKKY
jgi:iron(III) transport system permease protein